MSFKRVLAAINDSPATAKVFEQAIELAQKEAGQLMLFHSVELKSSSQATMSLAALEIQTEQAQALLQSYADKAKHYGIATEFNHYTGDPGINICALAEMESRFDCTRSARAEGICRVYRRKCEQSCGASCSLFCLSCSR